MKNWSSTLLNKFIEKSSGPQAIQLRNALIRYSEALDSISSLTRDVPRSDLDEINLVKELREQLDKAIGN